MGIAAREAAEVYAWPTVLTTLLGRYTALSQPGGAHA
jgi:hypothetical protein